MVVVLWGVVLQNRCCRQVLLPVVLLVAWGYRQSRAQSTCMSTTKYIVQK
jgi:hypothetical protein